MSGRSKTTTNARSFELKVAAGFRILRNEPAGRMQAVVACKPEAD